MFNISVVNVYDFDTFSNSSLYLDN